MEELLSIIEDITKWGRSPIENKHGNEDLLERLLVVLFYKYLNTEQISDKKDYPPVKRVHDETIRKNVSINFSDFGFYHTTIDCHKINEDPQLGVGDAIDDLTDIIIDLLEIKSRYKNNGEKDALCFFKFIFEAHTKEHLIELLKFLSNKKSAS